MQYQVLGVKRMAGKAKASGDDFDFSQIFVCVPVETSTGKTKVSGYGFEVATMELQDGALPLFEKVAFPSKLELKTDQIFRMGEFRVLVTGFEAVKPVARVA